MIGGGFLISGNGRKDIGGVLRKMVLLRLGPNLLSRRAVARHLDNP